MRFIQRSFVLLISVLFCGMISLNAQTTWTGATSTAWNLAGNWSAGIPDANDDVIIPNVTNAPLISAAGALAKSVTVQSGATLTINAAGVLSINSAVTQGLTNAGVVQNSGTINLGNLSGGFLSALKNSGTFNNNAGGKINIDNIGGGQSEALGVSSGSTFNNTGTITIGGIANGQTGSGGLYGLRNAGTFNNKPGGIIKIDKVAGAGLNTNSSFTNEGDIILGSSPVPGNTSIRNGINNGLDFFNKSTGKIWIDNYTQFAIDASNYSTFDNEGQITIGKLNANTNLITGNQTGVVNNKTGALFEATGSLPSTRYIGQGGTLSPGISGGSATAGWLSFSNGINLSSTPLSIDVNSAGTPGVNYDQIGVNGIAVLGSTLTLSFNSYTGATGDQVVILTSSGLSGKFSVVTGLPAGWTINYTATEVILSKGPLTGYNTWTGAANTSYTNAANWSKGTAPTTNDDVLIPAGTTNSAVLSGTGGRAKSVTVQSGATFTINAPGILQINGSNKQGIFNQGTVTNNGTITIGNTAATGLHGIVNAGTFNNAATGKINIDRASLSAFFAQENNINNAGLVTVGAVQSIPNLILNDGTGLLNNNTGGVLKGAGDIYVNRFVNAGGTISPGAPVGTIYFSAARNFANTILDIELNGKTTAGTDFDNVEVTSTATLGGTLNVTVSYTPTAGDEIVFLTATTVNGSFSTVNLPAGWAIQYLSNSVKLTYGQNYWTGAESNSWHTPGNWSTGAVPTADQAVIIPNVTNDPAVYSADAVAQTVTILTGGQLNISTSRTLTINGSPEQGLLNEGTVQSSGTITIGNTAAVGTNGIVNKGGFFNNPGSVINIDRIDLYQGSGIVNQANKYFTNTGIIRIGATAGTSTSAANTRGVRNEGIFANAAGAKMYIDRAYTAIENFAQNSNSFTNNGEILIGGVAGGPVMGYGIYTLYNFANGTSGIISIDRATTGIETGSQTTIEFINNGAIIFGKSASVTTLINIGSLATFSNNATGQIEGSGSIINGNFKNTGGSITPAWSSAAVTFGKIVFNNNRNLSNSILNMNMGGNAAAGVDYDQFVVNGNLTIGGTLNITVNYTPVSGDEITIISATAITGTFTTTNLPSGWTISYSSTEVKLTFGDNDPNTWTGAVSAAWATAGNWSKGVPVAGSIVVIPDVTRDPVISTTTAIARSVTVQSGGLLTINSGASLTLNGTATQSFLNQGTVQNNGTITIGNTTVNVTNAVRNEASFNNNAGAALIIAKASENTDAAILNASGTFSNSGNITIGSVANAGKKGIINAATFNNTGMINIDRTSVAGINNVTGNFENTGTIRIGANAASGAEGFYNTAVFVNGPGGELHIDRVSNSGINSVGNSTISFSNLGNIYIGSLSGGNNFNFGIYNSAPFYNSGGEIRISRVTTALMVVTGVFTNAARIHAGYATAVINILLQAGGTFSNETNGQVFGAGSINADRYLAGEGHLSPAGAGTPTGIIQFQKSEDLSTGTINIDVNGAVDPGVNYDLINVNGSLKLGGVLNLNFNYAGVDGDLVTIITAAAGITDRFVTVSGLPGGWSVEYTANVVYLKYAQSTTWTGAVNTDWTNAGNWNNGVPIAQSVVVIPNVTNDPQLNTATPALGNLIIQANGQLTVGSAGTLTVNGNGIQDILNEGALINNGIITIGNVSPIVTQFFYNKGQFTNNVSGQLIIAQVAANAEAAIVNENSFINYGTVTIGSVAALGKYGILNSGPFTNATGAQINIARTSEAYISHSVSTFVNNGNITAGTQFNINAKYGLYNNSVFSNGGELRLQNVSNTSLYHLQQSFTNSGTIRIGADGSAAADGINNAGNFSNESVGNIYIDLNTNSGIYHHGTGFTNKGLIAVNSRNVGGYSTLWGIYIDEAFNNSTGQITINRSTSGIAVNANTFTNTGTVSIGNLVAMTTLIANRGTGTFSNGVNGELKGTGSVESARFLNAGGKLSPGYTAAGKLTFSASESFTSSIINIKVNGAATAGTNYDQVAVNGTATIGGGTLNVNINYTPAAGDRITILTATTVQGTFNTITGLPAGWKPVYAATSVVLEYDATNYWTGNVSQAWNTTGNWSIGTVPGAGSTVVLPATGPVRELTVTVGASVANFEIAAGRTVTINSGSSITATNNFINNGTIKGGGRIVNAGFTNNGIIAPGLSPGTLSITGNFNNQGTIQTEIGGTTPGTLYDRLEVSGTVTLGGNLVITRINGFKPVAGQTYTIITGSSVTGSFASVTWPSGVTGTVTNTAGGVNLNIVSVLPLTLLEFNGQAVNEKVVLKWKTAEEVNTSHFNIERSTDGQHYAAIGNITAAGSGTGNYSFTDANAVNGNNYYRLKMIDIDGAYKYSPVVIVKFASKGKVTISPVPATSHVIFAISDRSLVGQRAQVFSPAGNLVASLVLTISNRIEIAHLPSGIYTIKTSSGSYRFIKQ